MKDEGKAVRLNFILLPSYFILSEAGRGLALRSEEHTSELQSRSDLVCRLLLEKKNNSRYTPSAAVEEHEYRRLTSDHRVPSEAVRGLTLHYGDLTLLDGHAPCFAFSLQLSGHT